MRAPFYVTCRNPAKKYCFAGKIHIINPKVLGRPIIRIGIVSDHLAERSEFLFVRLKPYPQNHLIQRERGMVLQARITVELLLRLKERYGDLNKALILLYIDAYGPQSENRIAQDVGLNRAVVRRALQELSDSDN